MKNKPYILLIASLTIAALCRPSAARNIESAGQEEQMFQAASQLFQENTQDKVASIDAFQRFLQRFSDSPRAADATFMAGEGYLQQALNVLKAEAASKKNAANRLMSPKNTAAIESLNNARDAFRTVVDRYRKSGLAASAQYRLGEVAYDQKDWGTAVEEFRKVDKNFTKSYLVPESWMGIIYADIALEQFSQAEANLFLLGETYPNYLKVPEVLYAQGIVNLHKSDYSGAERALSQVATAEAQFYLGKTYLLSKRPFLAATAFEHLVRDYSDSELREEAEFYIGDSFFLAQDYDGAITKYQRFLEKYPDSKLKVAAVFRIGSSHFQKKNYVDARANFQAVLDRYPQDFFAPLAQYFIAESYLVANQMREALFAYTKVITQFPDTNKISPLAHYKLAWTQYQVGDYTQTVQTAQNFLSLYPTHSLAKNIYLIAGNSFFQLKRYSEAVASWQRIIDLAPTSEIAEQALFSILAAQYKMKNFDSILTSYQFIFRHLPPSQSKWRSLSYLYAADAYLSLNQVDEAQSIYEMILKVYPNDVAAVYALDGLAWAHTFKGEDALAADYRNQIKDWLRTSRSTFTFSAENEIGIADSLFNQKNYEDAFQLYDKFVKENPSHPSVPAALYRAGMSLYHLRYYSQAIETWQKLQTGYPKSQEAQQSAFQMADTLFREQKYKDAIASYKDIIDKYPKNQQIMLAYLRIAQAAFNSKDDAGTIEQASLLIDRFPTAQEATDSLDLLDAVFDRSAGVDFRSVLATIIKNHSRQAIAGEAQFRLARRLFERKQYAKAAEEFQNFSVDFTDNPQLPKAQFLLAESYFQAGSFSEAIPAFTRYLNNFPKSDDTALALFHLGTAHYNQKEYDPATVSYQRLLEEYPDSEFGKAAQFNLALAFKALGRLDSAEKAYNDYIRRAGNSDPNAQSAQWELFAVQKDRKDYDAALDTLKQIQSGAAAGSDAALEAGYRVGELYSMMNRPDEAANSWEQLRQMRPAGNQFRLQGLIKLGEIYQKSDAPKAIAVYDDLARSATGELAKSAKQQANALRSGGGASGSASQGSADDGSNTNQQPAPKKKKSKKKPASDDNAGAQGGT